MSQKKKPLSQVTIRTTKYLDIDRSTGEVNKEIINMKLGYKTRQYTNTINHLKQIGIDKAEVVDFKEHNGTEYVSKPIPQDAIDFVKSIYEEPKKELTEEQKKIIQLEKQIEALINANKGVKEADEPEDERTKLEDEYRSLGKRITKAVENMDNDALKAEIERIKEENS